MRGPHRPTSPATVAFQALWARTCPLSHVRPCQPTLASLSGESICTTGITPTSPPLPVAVPGTGAKPPTTVPRHIPTAKMRRSIFPSTTSSYSTVPSPMSRSEPISRQARSVLPHVNPRDKPPRSSPPTQGRPPIRLSATGSRCFRTRAASSARRPRAESPRFRRRTPA